MANHSDAELNRALKTVTSFITRTEKIHGKFEVGTSQHSLLRNRIKALYISKALIEDELAQSRTVDNYSTQELTDAMPPILSIISKNKKAQGKYAEGTAQYKRFEGNIAPMYLSKVLLSGEIQKRE